MRIYCYEFTAKFEVNLSQQFFISAELVRYLRNNILFLNTIKCLKF